MSDPRDPRPSSPASEDDEAPAVAGPPTVSDGVDGLLFAWSDVAALSRAIRRIIENPTEAAEMGRAGRAKASSKFRWEILGPQVETIYEAAVRSRK